MKKLVLEFQVDIPEEFDEADMEEQMRKELKERSITEILEESDLYIQY